MSYMKLSLFLLFISLNAFSQKFTSKQCLEGVFSTEIKSEERFFGLVKSMLFITKDKCNIDVKYKGLLETVWSIDICREPIHFKVNSKGTQNVHKRLKKCTTESTDDFCYYLKELKTNLADHGLIFAKGLKEKLEDSHGQAFCTSLLLNRYFDDAYVFSTFEEPKNIYESQESCAVPGKESTEADKKLTEDSVNTKSEKTESMNDSGPVKKSQDNDEEMTTPVDKKRKF